MSQEEIKTYESFITSNKLFFASLNEPLLYLDFNIVFEFILLYLKLKVEDIKRLNVREDILDIIINDNYIICDEKIISNGKQYFLSDFTDIVNQIMIPKVELKDDVKHYQIKRIEKTVVSRKSVSRTLIDERLDFKSTLKVDNDTSKYVKKVEEDFLSNYEDFISTLISGDLSRIGDLPCLFFYSLISFYPLIYEKVSIPYSSLNIPTFSIAATKRNDHNSEIDTINEEIEEIRHQIAELSQKNGQKLNEKRKRIINFKLRILSYDEASLNMVLYNLYREKNIYNQNVIRTILEALQSCHIEINNNQQDPLLTIFTLEDNKVTNLYEMHLSVFANIIDNDLLFKSPKNTVSLSKCY